ncbi:hypothetical protein CC86DRAFT_396455 [Ophiobolus disseminans]|uniref:Xylanolytic transcriptional activator regulatory domain-containing protein n=1 Tax=Ophiobolus disseminans TaxID=1469910 RepID=A0A6A6ZRD0_9PLEO|nr:hypothetical protein CC86DRAFT_396455 [Ophiobolus disseminans]
MLRDLSERVSREDKQRIEATLDDVEDDLMSQATNASFASLGKHDRQQSANDDDQSTVPYDTGHGEAYVTASTGSNEDLDNLDEDLMRSLESRATGYVGQNSEIQWLRSVQRQTEHPGAEPRDQPHGPPGSGHHAVTARSNALHERRDNAKEDSRLGSMKHITDSTFYLDSEEIGVDFVDPNEDPGPDLAERLFRCYYETVHPSFPLVPDIFEAEFYKWLQARKNDGSLPVSHMWRAQLNLIFAIGAKYSHLIGADWQGDDRDHLFYMNRATHLLNFKDTAMIISCPDIKLVQATGSLAFYFLVIGHVSRAWIMIGVSIRLALALGLHLRNEDPTASESRKETLIHTWWSIHSIECLVSTMTGRPPVIAFEDCTVPLPRSLPGEQPDSRDPSRHATKRRTDHNASQTGKGNHISENDRWPSTQSRYFIGHIRIMVLVQKTLIELYSPRTATKSWQFIQGKILELLDELAEWKANASIGDSLADGHVGKVKGKGKQKADLDREHFLLKTDYWSTKILITRPCLCRIERRIRNESDFSADFNTTTAKECVEAALEITHLFPDDPDLAFLYSKGPWWSIVHLIMQAVAVLLLEMSYENRDMKRSEKSMTISIKKLMRWLRAMQYSDRVAEKAYKIIRKIIKGCDPSLQAQANELLALDDYDTGDRPPQTQGRPFDRSGTRSTPQMAHNSFHSDLLPTSASFGPILQQQDPMNHTTGYQDNMDFLFTPDEPMMPMSFGTPFFTSFDQGAPVLNIQDLWANTGPSAFNPNYATTAFPQNGNQIGVGTGDAELDRLIQEEKDQLEQQEAEFFSGGQ